jgi:hypothetical protein
MQTMAEITARLQEVGHTYSLPEFTAVNMLMMHGATFEIDEGFLKDVTRAKLEFERNGKTYMLHIKFGVYGRDFNETRFSMQLEKMFCGETYSWPGAPKYRFQIYLKEADWGQLDALFVEKLEDWQNYAVRSLKIAETDEIKQVAIYGTKEEREARRKENLEQQERLRIERNAATKQRIFEATGLTRNRKRELIFAVACDVTTASTTYLEHSEARLIRDIKKMLLVL